jgi:transcriptional regulator with XRE-family HTH domain
MIKERKKGEKKSKEIIHGNRIKLILQEIGMTQQELADITQLNTSHLSKIILGKRRCISLPIAFKISNALNRKIEDVFIAKKPKTVNPEEGD